MFRFLEVVPTIKCETQLRNGINARQPLAHKNHKSEYE